MGGVSYREITCKSALTRVQGMPFAWSLNPYTGCSHACRYCYARQYHALRGRDTGAGFDREVEVKINFADVLRVELKHLRLRELAALGTGTDPYQPAEGKYRLSRRSLAALCESPIPLTIITKGSLIVRDIDLLERLSALVDVRVCISIPTVNAEISRYAEPDAPPPRARLEALRRLRASRIDAGVLAAPVLPGLTDDDASLDAVAAAARDNGATFFHIRPLKLDPGVRPHYVTMIAEHFPALAGLTAARFAGRVNQDRHTVEELERRVEFIRARHGFFDERYRAEPAARVAPRSREASEPDQMRLAI